MGILLAALVFFLQFPMAMMDRRRSRPCLRVHVAVKLAANALYSCIGGLATVNSYRGVWLLLDAYLMPGEEVCRDNNVMNVTMMFVMIQTTTS